MNNLNFDHVAVMHECVYMRKIHTSLYQTKYELTCGWIMAKMMKYAPSPLPPSQQKRGWGYISSFCLFFFPFPYYPTQFYCISPHQVEPLCCKRLFKACAMSHCYDPLNSSTDYTKTGSHFGLHSMHTASSNCFYF